MNEIDFFVLTTNKKSFPIQIQLNERLINDLFDLKKKQ